MDAVGGRNIDEGVAVGKGSLGATGACCGPAVVLLVVLRTFSASTVAIAACHCITSAFMRLRERGDQLRTWRSLSANESADMLWALGSFCTI